MADTTLSRVLTALEPYDLKQEGQNAWRANSPLRPGSDSGAFTLTAEDGEHGAYHDFVSGEGGSLYELARVLGVTPVGNGNARPGTKTAYRNLAEYAKAHHAPREAFERAHWREAMRDGRPALVFPTRTGERTRFLDGEKPYFKSPRGYSACWYGINRAFWERVDAGQPLVLCNGEPSVVVAHHYELAALAVTGGEKKQIPGHLLDELLAEIGELTRQPEVIVAMDCDEAGRGAARGIRKQLADAGLTVRAVDLGLDTGGDLADFCGLHRENASRALRSLGELPDAAAEQGTREPRWRIIHADDLADLPPLRWLVDGVIPERGLSVLYGPSGSGKSFFALELAFRVAQAQPVLYVVGEGEYGYRQRLEALKHHHEAGSGQLYLTLGQIAFMDTADLEAFIGAAEAVGPAFIIIDTVARAMVGADENSTRDMGLFVSACDSLRRRLDSTVLLVHHTNKIGVVERGSGTLRAAADAMLRQYMEDEMVVIESSKTKDVQPFDPMRKQLLPVEVALDGETHQVPVLVDAAQIAPDPEHVTRSQRKLLEVLGMEVFVEQGARASEIDDLVEDVPSRTIYRGLSALLKRGYIEQPQPRGAYRITGDGLGVIGGSRAGDDDSNEEEPSAGANDRPLPGMERNGTHDPYNWEFKTSWSR